MDNPWGSPWASDEPTAEASPAATLPAGGAPASLDDAALPSPGALPAPSFASTTASAVDNGWGGSLNDGGWGGAEDLEREGWGAPAAAPAATPAASSSDEEDGTTEAELDFEPSPAPTPAPPPVSDEGQDDDDDASADSPVDLTPAVTTPDRTATPPVEPSPFASPPPSPPAGSPPAFPTSDSFNDFAPFSSPPALASSALAGAADDDPWGATASFDDGGDDDRGAWGSAAPVRADVDDDDAVPWKAESDSREREAAPLASQEEDEWAEARRRAAIRAQRAPRELVDSLKEQWSELASAQFPAPVAPGAAAAPQSSAQHEDDEDGEVPAPVEEATPAPQEATLTTEVDEHLNLRLDEIRNIADMLPTLLAPPESTALAYPTSATHSQFVSALRQSLRLSNSSSLLNTRRVSRPLGALPASAGPQLGDEWWDRSRLGEEEDRVEAAEEGEDKRGWFGAWSRRSSSQAVPVRSREGSADAGGSKPAAVAVARPPSVTTARQSIDRGPSPAASLAPSGAPSTQASPRPSLSLGPESTVPPLAEVAEPVAASSSAAPPPSAVSRFLGRFGRKAAANPAQSPKASLELSAGDFDFLAEVKGSSTQHQDDGISDDQGDFLSGFGVPVVGRGKQAALDNFLSSKPSVALPKPLAPPPAAPLSRSSSSFVAQPKPAAQPASSDLAGLDFLSFDAPPATAPLQVNTSALPPRPTASRPADDEWDDFVGSPVSFAAPTVPVLAPPLAPSLSASSRTSASSLPPILSSPSPAPSLPVLSPPPPPAVPTQAVPAAAHDSFADEDDFGDFGSGPSTPFSAGTDAHRSTAAFGAHNGFDDFDTFTSAPASHSPARLPPATNPTTLPSPNGPPEPVTKSPRHAYGPSSRWSMATPLAVSSLPGSPSPSSPSAFGSPPVVSHPPSRARTPGSASISDMASLVSHARNVSQSSHRGWSTSPVVAPTPLPAPLAPPPPPASTARGTASFLDDDDDDDQPLARSASPAAAAAPPAAFPSFASPVARSPLQSQVPVFQLPPVGSAPAPAPAASTTGKGEALSAADLDFFAGL